MDKTIEVQAPRRMMFSYEDAMRDFFKNATPEEMAEWNAIAESDVPVTPKSFWKRLWTLLT